VSPRSVTFMMVDKIAATDPHTVVIQLKFATSVFLPALADPYNWISIPSTITLSRSVLGVMQYAMGRHRPWAGGAKHVRAVAFNHGLHQLVLDLR